MIVVPSNVRVHLALGAADMRKGLCGLSMLVQKVLCRDPFSGHMFVFRGKSANYIKVLYWDGHRAVSLQQKTGARPLHLAYGARGGRHRDAQSSATLDADRGDRLALAGTDLATNCGRLIARDSAKNSWCESARVVESCMRVDLNDLPRDIALLHGLVRDLVGEIESKQTLLSEAEAETERLRLILKQLQRLQFGRRSERLDPDQFELGIDDLGADIGRAEARNPEPESIVVEPPKEAKSERKLPAHLPREDLILDAGKTCPGCGGALHPVGESVSEMLDWVPAQLKVIRIRRPKYGCRACGHDPPGAGARAADRQGHGHARPDRERPGRQVLRPPSPLPAGSDIRPPRRRDRPLNPRQLGRRGLLVARIPA